jgi:UDP-glucose 4-epimerase
MNKFLVTGGAGFIGSSLVNALIQSKNQVIVLDNLSKCNENNISKWVDNPNFKFIHADIFDLNLLRNSVNDCNIVFHLAANPDVRQATTNTKIDYEQNLLATYNLLEAMRSSSNCKKIIFTSSSTVYGEPEIMPTSEKYSPLIPISLYGATKLACEAMISAYCHMFNISGIVLRLANVVGPTSTHGVIHDFITKLSSSTTVHPKYLDVLGDGKQNKSYLYIDDCINALTHVMKIENERAFEIFNAGSKDRIDVLNIANIVIKELLLDNISIRLTGGVEGRGWKGDVKEMLLDSSKLETSGWKLKYNSREAVVLTVREIVSRLHNKINVSSYENLATSRN